MKDFSKMKPRDVEAYLRQVILETFGNSVEDASSVVASHGYYRVSLKLSRFNHAHFEHFRKKDAGKIARAIRALK